MGICNYEIIQSCADQQDEGSNQCSQQQDQGSNQCSQQQDQGSNQCSQQADEGYNSCSSWGFFSFLCTAWTWVSNWVCVAWTWVSNWVCVAWTWVSDWVCVAWTWVSDWVCVLWTSITKIVCTFLGYLGVVISFVGSLFSSSQNATATIVKATGDDMCANSADSTIPGSFVATPGPFAENSEWSLIPQLRSAAQTKNAMAILTQATLTQYDNMVASGSSSFLPLAQALADLAVTGQAAAASLQAQPVTVARLIAAIRPAVTPPFNSALAEAAAGLVMERVKEVWATLRSNKGNPAANRPTLGYICVSGEDDSPDVPVNVETTSFQVFYQNVVTQGIAVNTRYMIASASTQGPPSGGPVINAGDQIILYIHGHMSRLEEASDLAPQLIKAGQQVGTGITVIAFDQPCCGYSTMVDHTAIQKEVDLTGTPLLDFLESFIVNFVLALDSQLGIKDRIVAVVGGSLGGHMGLRLSTRGDLDWIQNIIAWSPASVWDPPPSCVFNNLVGPNLIDRINEQESATATRLKYFDLVFDLPTTWPIPNTPTQPDQWYRDDWQPCKTNLIQETRFERREIYNALFRQWHWRVALEMTIFNFSAPLANGNPFYSQIIHRLMLASGQDDNFTDVHIFQNTVNLVANINTWFANSVIKPLQSSLFIADTGHSIHNERPIFFAGQALEFILSAQ